MGETRELPATEHLMRGPSLTPAMQDKPNNTPASEAQARFAQISEWLQILQDNIVSLERKLNPALMPAVPMPGEGTVGAQNSVILLDALDQTINKIRDCSQHIVQLTDRCVL